MSDEAALLAAIAACPDEDTPRLAYADWLDEHDRPIHAEFIRLQIEIARLMHPELPARGAEFDVLLRRERELLPIVRGELLGPLCDVRQTDQFTAVIDRGLVASVRMNAGLFVKHSERLARLRTPTIALTDTANHWYEVVTDPHFSAVTTLVMRPSLHIHNHEWSLDSAIVDRMGELGRHNRLRGLNLVGCRIGDLGLLYLAGRADVWRLEDLQLRENNISDGGIRDMLETSIPLTLRHVNLSHNPITDRAAIALAKQWPKDSPLRSLDVRHTNIGPRGEEALRKRFGGIVGL